MIDALNKSQPNITFSSVVLSVCLCISKDVTQQFFSFWVNIKIFPINDARFESAAGAHENDVKEDEK